MPDFPEDLWIILLEVNNNWEKHHFSDLTVQMLDASLYTVILKMLNENSFDNIWCLKMYQP